MYPVALRLTRSYQFAPGDTAAHTLASQLPGAPASYSARLVQVQADSGNAGRVTLLGFNGGTADSNGPSLGAGEWAPPFWVLDLNQLGFQLATSTDKVNVLVGV